jgi:hypothetical protein
VKTFDLRVPEQAMSYQLEAALQLILTGNTFLSTDGDRVTVYASDEICIRPRDVADLFPAAEPGERSDWSEHLP